MIALEFSGFFLSILVFGYVLPAGLFYRRYHVLQSPSRERQRIQPQARPTSRQIRREIRMSLVSVLIFAAMATALFQLYLAGKTAVYRPFYKYPLYYLPISFALCVVVNDTWFYWTHRFMHLRRVFKYTHLGHHRFVSPTPWSIYAFQPLEAVIQFCGVAIMVEYIPMCPLVLIAWLSYDTLVNTAGHTGFEMIPTAMSRSWLFKWFNTVAHHDGHHTNTRANFGAFFNIWDRLLGTFDDKQVPQPQEVVEGKKSDRPTRVAAIPASSRSASGGHGSLVGKLVAGRSRS